MSLMNDMLRDLEKRQAPDRSQQVEAQGYGALTQKTETHSSRAVTLLLGVIIFMLLALAVGWWYLQTQISTPSGYDSGAINSVTSVKGVESLKDAPVIVDARAVTNTGVDNGMVVLTETVTEGVASTPKGEQVKESTVLTVQTYPVDSSVEKNAVAEKITVSERSTVNPAMPGKNKSSPFEPQNLSAQRVKSHEVAVKDNIAPAEVKVKKQPKVLLSNKVVDKPINEATKTLALSKVLVISAEQRDENAADVADNLIERGRLQAAKVELKTFIESNDVDVKSRALLVTMLMQEGDMVGANALLTSKKLSKSSHLRRLKAHWLAQSGQPDEAIALLNSTRPSVEADPEYQVLLAALYQQQGFSSEAVAVYAELLSFNPKVADWWAGMAIALDSSQQYPSAKKAYQKALQMEGLRFELADFAKQRLETLGG